MRFFSCNQKDSINHQKGVHPLQILYSLLFCIYKEMLYLKPMLTQKALKRANKAAKKEFPFFCFFSVET